jgi:hypothetical protein
MSSPAANTRSAPAAVAGVACAARRRRLGRARGSALAAIAGVAARFEHSSMNVKKGRSCRRRNDPLQ